MQRVIEVVDHDPGWKGQFEAEADIWRRLLGKDVVAIHHVGSTAIPGICAKPIIDLLVVVRDIERVDELDAEMVSRGYLPRGEYGIPGRRFFIKGTETHRTHPYSRVRGRQLADCPPSGISRLHECAS